jgi:phospholipase A1
MTEAVIFLPGIMGSELFLGADGDPKRELIWPGSVAELLLPYKKMKQLLDPNLTVGDIIRSVSVSSQYDSLVAALGTCGFVEGKVKPTLIVCPYDWRKDNALAAERLAVAVAKLRAVHGAGTVINLIAHSMGGLVCRYFLESGGYSEATHPGFSHIQRLITIGTPHRGAPLALHAAMGQIKRLFLSASQVSDVANNRNFPAMYQLMPPPTEPFLWDLNPQSRLAPKSPHDAAIATQFKLSKENLASAAAFHKALDVARRPHNVDYFCFVGTRQETVSNVRFDFGSETGVPAPVDTEDGGDGTVPSWSGSFAGMQQLLVGGDHGGLYKPDAVLQALAALLGKAGVLAAMVPGATIRLSIRNEVVLPKQTEQLALFLSSRTSIDATVVIRKLTGEDGMALPAPAEIDRLPVLYTGPAIDSIALTLTTPKFPGSYEIDIESAGKSVAERKLVLFVQNP